MKRPLIYIVLLLSLIALNFYATKPAHSATHTQCINMMQLYFLWLDQNKLKRAEKQFRVVMHSCHQLKKSSNETRLLKAAIEGEIKMMQLYADIINSQNIKPVNEIKIK